MNARRNYAYLSYPADARISVQPLPPFHSAIRKRLILYGVADARLASRFSVTEEENRKEEAEAAAEVAATAATGNETNNY